MRILVTGGTGFIGKALGSRLAEQGHETVLLSRHDVPAPGMRLPAEQFAGVDAIVNMAGESIAGSRWTNSYKHKIRDSRLTVTRCLADTCLELANQGIAIPKTFVSISAVGYYGNHPTADFTEQSPAGAGWLANVAKDWEAEAGRVEAAGVRQVVLRLGVVLGPGGFLDRLKTPFLLFAGGPAGSGQQWISWIHRDDVISVIEKALTDVTLQGAYNLTAPAPVTMDEMAAAIGTALHRPSWLRTPSWLLRLLLGEMAEELILKGQRVLPERLRSSGFVYRQPELQSAVTDSFGRNN